MKLTAAFRSREFGKLSTRLYELVRHYFGRQVQDPKVSSRCTCALLYNLSIMPLTSRPKTAIDVSGTQLISIPQVGSNSPVARSIRCAMAEAVISQELSRTIFQQFYVTDDDSGVQLDGIIRALSWLNKKHPQEALVVRCQLARALNQSSEVRQRPTQSAQKVGATLSPWLGGNQIEQFVKDLQDQFTEAMALWQPLQQAIHRVEARTDLSAELWYWDDRRPQYDEVASGADPAQTLEDEAHPIAVLFPQIYTKGPDPLFHGYALFSTQPVYKVAVQERRSLRSSRTDSASYRRRMSSGPAGMDHHAEQQTKGGRRASGASGDGSQQRTSVFGSDLSSSSAMGSRGRQDMTASILSTKSRKSGSGVDG